MRTLGIGIGLALLASVVVMAGQPAKSPAAKSTAVALPQAPATPQQVEVVKTFASAADVQALLAKAKAEKKDGAQVTAERIMSLAPYRVNLEYRTIQGDGAIHETEAEMMYVIDGVGTITTGGTIVDPKRTGPHEIRGTTIEGGMVQPVAKGDFIFIPENTPHQFSSTKPALVMMTFHVPRPVPTAAK